MGHIVGFSSGGGDASPPDPQEMLRRLADPLEREQVRKDERVQVQARHPDIAVVLGMDTSLETQLVDLLTDQQMRHLDWFYAGCAAPPVVSHVEIQRRAQEHFEEETRCKQQIRELLGEEIFERYLDYCTTLGERWQVAYFCGRLGAEDALTSLQKDQLLSLLRADRDRIGKRRTDSRRRMEPESTFRQMKEDSQLLLQRLPDILTPSQLQAYARMEEDKIASQREYVQKKRRDAGMSPEFEETSPAVSQSKRTLVDGQVRAEIRLTINSQPLEAVFQVANGTMIPGWRAPEGLWVEATPLLFDDGWVQVDFKFYEERGERRRPLGGGFSTGYPGGNRQHGGGTTVSGVNKTYVIQVLVKLSLISG